MRIPVLPGLLAAGIAVTLAGVVGVGALGVTVGTPSAGLSLREGSAGRVDVTVPAPGAASRFHVTARSDSAEPSRLVLLVEDGSLPDEDDGVRLALWDESGALLADGTVACVQGVALDLGVVAEGPVTVHGEAVLPETATGAASGETLSLDVRIAGDGAANSEDRPAADSTQAARDCDPTPGAQAPRPRPEDFRASPCALCEGP